MQLNVAREVAALKRMTPKELRGRYGPGEEEPDGEITPWDITGFTQRYLTGNLDADMAGYGPGEEVPDGDVNPWDISGFTSRYSAALAAGTHLEPLPTAGGQGMAAGGPTLLPPETALLADRRLTNEDTSHARSHEAISALLVPQFSLSAEMGNLASSGKFGDSLRADEEIGTGTLFAPPPAVREPMEPSVELALAPGGGVPDLLALSALDVRL